MGIRNKSKRLVIHGTVLSGGMATGKAFFYEDILSSRTIARSIASDKLDDEIGRISAAMAHVSDDIDNVRKDMEAQKNSVANDIFMVHKEMINDVQLARDMRAEIGNQHVNAEQVIRNVFRRLVENLTTSDSEIIRAKTGDIEDLGLRILRVLSGYEHNPLVNLPEDSIVISKRLLPPDTVHIKKKNIKGILVETGSRYSHCAILAKSFGITCLTNLSLPLTVIKSGDRLLLDGNTGIVIVNPSEKDLVEHEFKEASDIKRYNEAQLHKHKLVKTKKGKEVIIYANAYSKVDFKLARESNCDGIGLVRLEQLYMSVRKLPTENEIIKELSDRFKEFPKESITIRLLDVGGDKKLPYLKLKDELNPALGLRGIRFLLKHKDILKTQLRAILKLSKKFNLRLLIPMVTTSEDIKETKNILWEYKIEIEKETGYRMRNIKLGAMIETPAAVIHIEDILERVSFISIGTNDLTQYLMVACRENSEVAHYYRTGARLVLKTIEHIIKNVSKAKKEKYVCGELASDCQWIEDLLNTGVSRISVSPYRITELKKKIQSVN